MNRKRRLVFGVGINDANYCVQRHEAKSGRQRIIWSCPYYGKWRQMLKRCYSQIYQRKFPTYVGCEVSNEWLRFSVFRAWMEEQDWEGMCLDKDIIFVGNKIYSDKTCTFIPDWLNKFFNYRDSGRGVYMIGASWHSGHKKFQSYCGDPTSGKTLHLGYFETQEGASAAWVKAKADICVKICEKGIVRDSLVPAIMRHRDFILTKTPH